MGYYGNINGTDELSFAIGKTGPILKNVRSVLTVRRSDDRTNGPLAVRAIAADAGRTGGPSLGWSADRASGFYRITTGSIGIVTSNRLRATITSGMQLGRPTGGDKGAGTLNAQTGLYVNGTAVLTGNQSITLSGDIRGTGSTSIRTTLATVNRNVGSYSKVTVNAKGLVTAATAIDRSDVTTALGYTPVDPGSTNSFTAAQTFRTTGTGTVITAESTDSGSTSFPAIRVYRDRRSPAPGDLIGGYIFAGQNRSASQVTYGAITGTIGSATAAAESGAIIVQTVIRGTLTQRMLIENGVTIGLPTGGDMGAGTLNAEGLYVNGVSVSGGGGLTQGQAVALAQFQAWN